MFYPLLLADSYLNQDELGIMMVIEDIPMDVSLTPWFIYFWLSLVLRACRRAHSLLAKSVDLSSLSSGKGRNEQLTEIANYVKAFSPRGPPSVNGVTNLLNAYYRQTNMFFLGRPSQER